MKAFLLTLCASVLLMSGARSYEADYHLGEWIGTWHSGDTSGHFDLALERAPDGQLIGNIDVATDGGKASEYAVDLRHVAFEGDNFTATFVTPGKSAAVIKLTGSLSKQAGSGEWVAHQRVESNAEAQVASATGTWELQKYER
jgi:hypothetical protein